MKILNLTLEKKWFDMILSGEKKEEYREIKPHWTKRIISIDSDRMFEFNFAANKPYANHLSVNDMLLYYGAKIKHFNIARIVNGYGSDKPAFDIEIKGIWINTGLPEFGAVFDNYYYVITMDRITKLYNIR